jgi:hypothetical protein
MATRSVFGGQRPSYKFPSSGTVTEDGQTMVYDHATGKMAFTQTPVIAKIALSAGSTVPAAEDGGTGAFDTLVAEAHVIRMDGGDGEWRNFVTFGASASTSDLTGGGTSITITVPAILAGLPDEAPVCAIATVTDSVGRAPCYVAVENDKVIMTRVAGNFAAGPATIDAFNLDYFGEHV